MLNVIEGQVSIFDIPVITHKEEVKNVMKRVIFKPKQFTPCFFFNSINYIKFNSTSIFIFIYNLILFANFKLIEKISLPSMFEDIKE